MRLRIFPDLFTGLLTILFLFPVVAHAEESVFGKQESEGAALIGTFYDLKQTQRHDPTNVNPENYKTIVEEFLSKKWDEAILNRYFRATRAMYTTQIFIPRMNATTAPKAFGVEKIVQPSCWIIHYKGQISPPEDGTYRFVAEGDDVIAVAVNGKTVLYAPGWDANQAVWKQKESISLKMGWFNTIAGDWIDLKKGEPIDFDVIFGERPGTFFDAFVLYQKMGVDYASDEKGPILPILQVAPYETPDAKPNEGPHFLKGAAVWKCYQ